MSGVHRIEHTSADVFLTTARDKNTPPDVFRDMMRRISYIMATGMLDDAPTMVVEIDTPLQRATGIAFDGRIALVPVMRAGAHMLPGFRDMLVNPPTWQISLSRDEETLETHTHSIKVPDTPPDDIKAVIVLEIMLATGGSSVTAINILKDRGYENIVFVCVVAAPEGIERLLAEHPDVEIFTVAIDARLTDDHDDYPNGYIIGERNSLKGGGGLGDAGDRAEGNID